MEDDLAPLENCRFDPITLPFGYVNYANISCILILQFVNVFFHFFHYERYILYIVFFLCYETFHLKMFTNTVHEYLVCRNTSEKYDISYPPLIIFLRFGSTNQILFMGFVPTRRGGLTKFLLFTCFVYVLFTFCLCVFCLRPPGKSSFQVARCNFLYDIEANQNYKKKVFNIKQGGEILQNMYNWE